MPFKADLYRPSYIYKTKDGKIDCIHFTKDSLPHDMDKLKATWVNLISKTAKGRMQVVYTEKNKSAGCLQFGLPSKQEILEMQRHNTERFLLVNAPRGHEVSESEL